METSQIPDNGFLTVHIHPSTVAPVAGVNVKQVSHGAFFVQVQSMVMACVEQSG